jgi:hypothetical protein
MTFGIILTNAEWVDHRPVVTRYPASTPAILRSFDHYNKDKPYSDQIRPWDMIQAYWGKGKDKGYWLAPASADPYRPAVVINRDSGEIRRSPENMLFVTYFDMFCDQQAPHNEDMICPTEMADGKTFNEGRLLRPHYVEKGRRISIGKEMHKLIELEMRNDPDGSKLTVPLEHKRNGTSCYRQRRLGERNGIAVGHEFIEQCDDTYTDDYALDLLEALCKELGQTAVGNALGVGQQRASRLLRTDKIDTLYKAEIIALAQRSGFMSDELSPSLRVEIDYDESDDRDHERMIEGFRELGIDLPSE